MIVGDAFNLPFRDTFDMVYSFRFIRHFERREREMVYGQIHSHLKPGGLFLFDAVNAQVALPLRLKEGPTKYLIYDELYHRDALVAEITQHGFDVVSLLPVMRQMDLQKLIQVVIGPRSIRLATGLIRLLELVPGPPLEWIVICRKRAAQ